MADTKFDDIKALKGTEQPLQNVVLSSRPCPDCQEADGMVMTYDEWAASQWGLPGSSGRVCEDDCHCTLIPVDMLDDFPGISDRVKLRGDKDSDIRGMVEIGPNEGGLKQLMQDWYELGNDILPREIYDMDFDAIEPYLRSRIAALKKALGDVKV